MLRSGTAALLAIGIAWGQKLEYAQLGKPEVLSFLNAVAIHNADREHMLQQLFLKAGCPEAQIHEEPVRGLSIPNLVCSLPGETNRVILLGAHTDHVEHGIGAVDNWSGSALLPALYQSLRGKPRRHTFAFAGFTGEERGLLGSAAYAKNLGKEGCAQISAMVNVDSVGTASTKVATYHGDPLLLNALARVADTLHSQLQIVNFERVGKTDSWSFHDHHVPVVDFHSLTQETYPVLHTDRDQLTAIRPDDYYETYRLLAVYLAYLDVVLDGSTPSQ